MHAPGRLVSSLRYTRFTTRTEWTGTASELLGTLGEMAGERVANPKTYWRFYRVSNATEKRNGQNCEARWVDGRDQSNSEWKATDRKAPSRGILECERCGRREANAERDENGWELWYLQQRYSDLCPACVPVVTRMCGESRRIPNPQFLTADELFGGAVAEV